MLYIFLIGYIVALCGFIMGIFLSRISDKYDERFYACLMGFTAGLLLAFICFEILPIAFQIWGLYPCIIGILLGVLFAVLMDGKIQAKVGGRTQHNHLKTGLLIGIGVSIHNIPEGLALGSLLQFDLQQGIKLGILIAIHCLPEACAVFMPLRKSGVSYFVLLLTCFIFALSMAFGTLFGAIFSTVTPVFIAVCLSFAGGVMLYITCGEIIPESKGLWHSRITTFFSCIGFIFGIFLIQKL